MKRSYRYLPLLIILSLVIYFTYEAYATSTGRVLRTSTYDGGCGGSGCHGTGSSSSTSLSLISGNLTVDPNTTNNFTIRVSNSSKERAGINIAAKTTITGSTNIGNLEAPVGSGLQVLVDELTHVSPKAMSNGNADFDFTWKAPAKPGKYYLRAAGNAVNNDNTSSGDQWNWMTPMELIVRGIEILEPIPGNNFCAGNTMTIKWNSAGVEDIKIELSTNSGQSWGVVLNNSFKAVGGNWTWNIPNDFQQGPNFRIKLSDVANPNISSEMSGDFGIYGQFSITSHPTSKEMCPGESLTLSVSTIGTGLKYQWRKNGFNIPNATDSVLVISNVNSGTTGFYGVVVSSNCYSPITSTEANIQIRTPTSIRKQPTEVITCLGNTPIFQVEADGHFVTYQWYKDNRAINNATTPELKILDVKTSDIGSYYCEVKGFCGTVKSNTVPLTINEAPKITTQPLSQTTCEKKNITFKIVASGLLNNYEWYFNNNKITSSSIPDFVLNNVGVQNQGEYYCIVRNNCGEPVTSNVVQLTVNLLPRITSQPKNLMLMAGEPAEFTVIAENAKSYLWRKNGTAIPDAREATYRIETTTADDNGDYDCLVTNECGNVTSIKANLLVIEPEPGARIKLSSGSIDFGITYPDVVIDSTFDSFISNIGNQILKIDSIKILNAIDTLKFFELLSEGSYEIEQDESIPINIKLTPDSLGLQNAKLRIYSNAINDIGDINIVTNVAKWDAISNKSLIDFEDVLIGDSNELGFRIFNQSDFPLSISGATISCDDFYLLSPEIPAIVDAKSSKDFLIKFEPTKTEKYDCKIEIDSYRTLKKITVKLSGVGKGTGVNDSDNLISNLSAFPNPVNNNHIKFEFSIPESMVYEVLISDNSGNTIWNYKSISQKDNIIDWNCKNLQGHNIPSGIYNIIVKSDNSIKKTKIVIIK